jgi:hypothetical protein
MTIQAYRTQPFKTTHENRIFYALMKELKRLWGDSEDLVLLLGNFYCQGSEIDAAVLKRDSITVIDFKDYKGRISFSENDRWLAGNVEVRGGNKPNPFIQVRYNKFALLNSLKEIGLPSGRQPNLGHISGLVLFHKPITFDDRQLPPNLERWFHVVDFDHAVERLSQITSREINLSNQDLETIPKALSIPEHIPVGASVRAVTPLETRVDTTEPELPQSLQSAMSRIAAFLNSSEQILIVTGMIGTGLEQLLKAIAVRALTQGRNYTVLAPNRRIALRYPIEVEAESIYTHLYSRNPKFQKDQIIYDLTANNDTEKHLYIVGDAHLVSDSQFETDVLRYGSGQLLTDLLNFAEIKESERQIIFLGDPFQLTRGKADESALFTERLQAITGCQVDKISLEYILAGKEEDVFVGNCLELARCIREGIFNQLCITTDGLRCIEAQTGKADKHQLLQNVFIETPKATKFIAFSHAEVNQINNWLRQKVFGRDEALGSGDIVHIHNSFFVKNKDELERPIYIPNDSFAEVIAVNNNVEPLVQRLNGRDKSITVPFLDIKVRLLQDDKEIEFLCLKNYLYAEKPEVEPETILALHVWAKTRFRQDQKKRNEESQNVEAASVEESDNSDSPELAKFLRSDPYLNAARLRFGYALTLHRAQGQRFSTVIANMDTGQGQTNEAYSRWVYTLFSIVQDRLILSNVPLITPFYKAIWDDSKGRFDFIRPCDLIAFDPDAEAGLTEISDFSIPEQALRNLYLYIVDNLKPQGINVKSYKHHNYQEIYDFERVEKRELGKPFDKLERIYGLVKHHWQGKAFVYLTPYKECSLSYAEFPEIEKVPSGNAVEISCSRHGDRINPYRFSPSIFLENENISLLSGIFRLHQKGFGFVKEAFVPPDLASQLKDGQEVSLVVVKKLDNKKNQLGWTAITILDECDRKSCRWVDEGNPTSAFGLTFTRCLRSRSEKSKAARSVSRLT